MIQEKVKLAKKQAEGYVVPLGPVNLVFVITDAGMVGCGAFDVLALDKFSYPAARVKPTTGPSISTIDDLLAGEIKDANSAAAKRGVVAGMSGREALDLM
jgi:uncharacterized protein YunC (DUF1805 family)